MIVTLHYLVVGNRVLDLYTGLFIGLLLERRLDLEDRPFLDGLRDHLEAVIPTPFPAVPGGPRRSS